MIAEARDLHVVMIVPSLGTTGGLERVATTFALNAAPQLGRLVVCSRGGNFERVLGDAGVPVEIISRPRQSPTQMLRAARDLARVLRREQPNLVHAHNPISAVAATLALPLAGLRGVPVVTSYHGVALASARHAVPALRATSDLVVAVAPAPARALLEGGFPRGRLVTVFNAVEAEPTRTRAEVHAEFGIRADEQLVVTIGRYVEEKNQHLLLETLALVRRTRPTVRALVVGEGPLEDELRAHARELGLAEDVTFTGPRDDAVSITAAADVFVLSSASEGLPLALLEAMTLARPIASTRVGGIGDAIHDDHTGLLVPPHDAPALAGAIGRLLDDASLRRRLGDEARASAERRFSLTAMVERMLCIYASVAAMGRRNNRRRTSKAP